MSKPVFDLGPLNVSDTFSVEADGKLVALTFRGGPLMGSFPTGEQQAAYATLFAAAPELRKALSALLDCTVGSGTVPDAIFEAAIAALAKAGGAA